MSGKRVRLIVSGTVSLVLGAAIVLMAGCQTVKGVGQDVKNAGEAGERAINGK